MNGYLFCQGTFMYYNGYQASKVKQAWRYTNHQLRISPQVGAAAALREGTPATPKDAYSPMGQASSLFSSALTTVTAMGSELTSTISGGNQATEAPQLDPDARGIITVETTMKCLKVHIQSMKRCKELSQPAEL
jgi:hypothetical protein